MTPAQAVIEKAAAKEYLIKQRRLSLWKCELIGSCVVRDDPKDIDILCLSFDSLRTTKAKFEYDGWVDCATTGAEEDAAYAGGSVGYDEDWFAVRKGRWNAIVTAEQRWYDATIAASNVCRLLNVTDKPTRIAVYSLIRDGTDLAEALAFGHRSHP